MKKVTLLLLLLILVRARAQDYNGPTTAGDRDLEQRSLQKINKILSDAKLGTAPLTTTATPTGAAQLTPSFAAATADGATTAGKKVLIFILSSDFTGTIGGIAFAGTADSTVQLRAPEGSSFAAVAYTRSAGTIRVIQF